MFETLGKDIAALGDHADGEGVRAYYRLLEQMLAAGAVLVAEFETSQEWALDGAVNLTQWLTEHCHIGRDDAHRMRALARATRLFPVTAAAFQSGELSSAQVRAIAANVPRDLEPVFADRETDIIPSLCPLTARHTERAMKHWKQITQDEFDRGEPPAEPESSQAAFTHRPNDTWRAEGTWNNDDGQLINTALWQALTDDIDGEPARTHRQKIADAFTDICRFYLGYHDQRLSPRRQPHVGVSMTQAEYHTHRGGRYHDGSPVHPTTVATLLCDGVFSRVVHAQSIILDYGRSVKAVPHSLRRAVIHRDHHCRFGNCDRPPQWCDTHHHHWWEHGGPTNLTNLVLLCNRHHHLLHTPGWHSTLTPDGTLTITTPHGRTIQSRPPP